MEVLKALHLQQGEHDQDHVHEITWIQLISIQTIGRVAGDAFLFDDEVSKTKTKIFFSSLLKVLNGWFNA